ncbi:MAG: hypothetical protein NT056_09585 [Proteobacteria bacterium]|nr:hypothetical protein [Pseudomonadota bacterium]
MKNISKRILDLLTGSESGSWVSALPIPLSPSFNLLLENRPGHFDPVTVNFLESGEIRLQPGFDYGLDLTVRADPGTWDEILSGRSTLLSEFFAGRVRFRNQRTAWNRFCLLSYFLSRERKID